MAFARILLVCALGEDISEDDIDFYEHGVLKKVSVAYSLRETFSQLLSRMSAPHIFFFPILANTFITPFER